MNEDQLVEYIEKVVEKQLIHFAETQPIFLAIDKDNHQLTVTDSYTHFDSVPVFVNNPESFKSKVEKDSYKILTAKPKEVTKRQKTFDVKTPDSWFSANSPETVWMLYSSMRNASEYHWNQDAQMNMFNQSYHNYMNGLVQALNKLQHTNSSTKLVDIYPDDYFIVKRYGTTSDCRFSCTGYPLVSIDTLRLLKDSKEEDKTNAWEKAQFTEEVAIGLNISQWNLPSFRKVYGLIQTMHKLTSCISERYVEYDLEQWLEISHQYNPVLIYDMLSLLSKDLFFVGVRFGYVSFKNIQVLVLMNEQTVQFSKYQPFKLSKAIFRVVGYEFVKTIQPDEAEIKKHVIQTITWLFKRVSNFFHISTNILVRLEKEIGDYNYEKFKAIENVDPQNVFLPQQSAVNPPMFKSVRDVEVYMQLFPFKEIDKNIVSCITNVFKNEANSLITKLNSLKIQKEMDTERLVDVLSMCYRVIGVVQHLPKMHPSFQYPSDFIDTLNNLQNEYFTTIQYSNLHNYKRETVRFQDEEFLDQLYRSFTTV